MFEIHRHFVQGISLHVLRQAPGATHSPAGVSPVLGTLHGTECGTEGTGNAVTAPGIPGGVEKRERKRP
jgi:hypothetical protein